MVKGLIISLLVYHVFMSLFSCARHFSSLIVYPHLSTIKDHFAISACITKSQTFLLWKTACISILKRWKITIFEWTLCFIVQAEPT